MAAVPVAYRIAVEAPDGAAALELERRLAHLSPSTVSRRGAWVVDIPAAPGFEEVEAVVRRWLLDMGIASSVVHVDGAARVIAPRPSHRASNAGFIG
jgi:hypothetical protein